MDTLEVDANDLIEQRSTEGWQGWPKMEKSATYILKHMI